MLGLDICCTAGNQFPTAALAALAVGEAAGASEVPAWETTPCSTASSPCVLRGRGFGVINVLFVGISLSYCRSDLCTTFPPPRLLRGLFC